MYRLFALVGRSTPAAGCLGRYTCRPPAPAARPGAPARTSAPRPIGGALRGRPSPAAVLGCSSSARLGEQASRTPAITGCAHGPSPRLRGDQRSCRCVPPPVALAGRLAACRGGGVARSRLAALADAGRLPLPRPRHRAASRAATRALARPWRQNAWHGMVSAYAWYVHGWGTAGARLARGVVCARHIMHGVGAVGPSWCVAGTDLLHVVSRGGRLLLRRRLVFRRRLGRRLVRRLTLVRRPQ